MRTWAWYTALRLLSTELPKRWEHVQGVARRAIEVAELFPDEDAEVLISAAWLHDIGYAEQLWVTGFHPLDGARFLRDRGVATRVSGLVAHHSGASASAELMGLSTALAEFPDERSTVRDALWYCDAAIGPAGQPMSFDERISDLRERRGPDHPSVRALATGLAERRAAVERTERLLGDRSALVG
jgi:putative nucleotidyltransferase with HDIG domain